MKTKGFTLVELLVAIVLTSLLLMLIYQLFISYQKTVLVQEDIVETQQAARSVLSRLKSDLMMIGRNAQVDLGQEMMIYAAPWELLFNGDIHPSFSQAAANINYGPNNNYTYVVSDWGSTAETVRYLMVAPGTGLNDHSYSESSHDRELRRVINGVQEDTVGFALRYFDGLPSASYADGGSLPLFSFWGDFDFDVTTPDTLWGDTSPYDGKLDSDELQTLFNGDYSISYTAPNGATRTVSNMPAGAVNLISSGASSNPNSEDLNANHILDEGEDFNHNGKLDTNVLSAQIHRIELNVITIARKPDNRYRHPRDPDYHFRETWATTSVEPRNLQEERVRDCGNPPLPPSNLNAAKMHCGRGVQLTWTASLDDYQRARDVLWYEIERRVMDGVHTTWTFHAYVPADGSTTYGYLDKDTIWDYDPTATHPWTYYRHDYRVKAVDCGNNESTGNPTDSETPDQEHPTLPGQNRFFAYDTPCYTDGTLGSIALVWEASMVGSNPDSTVTEYWVYRSDPNDVDEVNEWEVARLSKTRAVNLNSSASSLWDANRLCMATSRRFCVYQNLFIWYDELDGEGRWGGALVPHPGSMYDVGMEGTRYIYSVRAYSGHDECLSEPSTMISECQSGNNILYEEIQSSDNKRTGAGGSGSRSYFSPPWDLLVEDNSTIGFNGLIETPRFALSWEHSLDEYCADNTLEEPTHYYVYRNKTQNNPLIKGTSPPTFNWDNREVIVFPALAADDSTTATYTWIDDADLYKKDASHTPAYLNISTRNFAPATGSVPGGDLYDGANPESIFYDYMVTAGKNLGGGAFAFGASCIYRATFECITSCTATVQAGTPYIQQHSMRGDKWTGIDGDDTIRNYFQFASGGAPPDGATIFLLARKYGQPWQYAGMVNNPSGNWSSLTWYRADHQYSGYSWGSYSFIAQDPGTTYEYGLEVVCDLGSSCQRRLLLNVNFTACQPNEPEMCFKNTTGCPSDAGGYCPPAASLSDNGKVVWYVTDKLISPFGGRSQTADAWLWFLIKRYIKFPWENDSAWREDLKYLIRADRHQYTGTGFSSFYGTWSASFTSTKRRYRFQEYLDPNMHHKYYVETRTAHNVNPPYTCYNPACTGAGMSNLSVYYYDFQSVYPCYPYRYSGFVGPANPQTVMLYRDPFGRGNSSIDRHDHPWMNYELTIVSWDLWGWHFYIGHHLYEYDGHTIQADFDSFFGGWIYKVLAIIGGDLGPDICDFCIFPGLNFTCMWFWWGGCYDWFFGLFNRTYLWSAFQGECKQPGGSEITGDFLMQWHWRSKVSARRLTLGFRASTSAAPNYYVSAWLLEQDFSPSGQVHFSIGYEHGRDCTPFKTVSKPYHNRYDNDWWSNLLLVCTRRRSGDPDRNQMFVAWWSEWDTTHSAGSAKDLQKDMYTLAPKFKWKSTGARHNGTLLYNSWGTGLAKHEGDLGFWADPFIDLDHDIYYTDLVRVARYCGDCPPKHLGTFSKSKNGYWFEGSGPKRVRKAGDCTSNWRRAVPKSQISRDMVRHRRPEDDGKMDLYKPKSISPTKQKPSGPDYNRLPRQMIEQQLVPRQHIERQTIERQTIERQTIERQEIERQEIKRQEIKHFSEEECSDCE